jgi:tetratricopeptide (TPR) repeat protein
VERLFGAAVLHAADLDLGSWSRATELRAEIPGQRFAVELGQRIDRFRTTRAVLRTLAVEVDGARLSRAVSAAAREAFAGGELSVELLPDELRVAFTPAVTRDEPWGKVIARFALMPDVTGDRHLHAVAFDYLVLGELPGPGPAVISAVLEGALNSAEFRTVVPGVAPLVVGDTVRVDAARIAAFEAFARRGWKPPGTERLRWSTVSVAAGRATLVALAEGTNDLGAVPTEEPRNRRLAEGSQELRAVVSAAEDALFGGDPDAATDGYLAALERYGSHPFLRARYFSCAPFVGDEARFHEARAVAAEITRQSPDPSALAFLATASARQGALDDAIEHTRGLAELLREMGRDEDHVDALLYGARLAGTRSAADAMQWVARALRIAPRNPLVLRERVRLARALGDAEAYEDGLVRLLSLARSRSARARLHREVGRLARDVRKDVEAARMHFREAARLTDDDPETLIELARASEALGRWVEAIRTFRRAAERWATAAPPRAARALTAAAELWLSRLGDRGNALVDLQRAVELDSKEPRLHVALVRVAADVGDGTLAVRAIETALARIDREAPDGRKAVARILEIAALLDERRGKHESAEARRRQRAALLGEEYQPSARDDDAASGEADLFSAPVGPRFAAAPGPPRREHGSDASREVDPDPLPTTRTDLAPPTTSPAPDPAEVAARRVSLDARVAAARRDGALEELARLLPELAEIEGDTVRRASLLSELGQLLYYDLEDTSRALQFLEEAQRLDPDGAGSDYGLLSALEALYEDTASGEGLLAIYRRKLAQAGSDEIRSVYRLLMAGILFEQLGRPDDAIAQLDAVLRTDPRSVPALRLRAKVHEATGKPEEAARAMADLVDMPEIDPFERQGVLRELGHLEWESLGSLEAAATRFEALLSEIPGDTDCISSLKQIHARAGRWEGVLDVLRRELGILAGSPEAFSTIAEAVAAPPTSIPVPLHGTYARILSETAEVAARGANDRSLGLEAARAAMRLAGEDAQVIEHALGVALEAEAWSDAVDAALALLPQLVGSGNRARLVERVRDAAARCGRSSELLPFTPERDAETRPVETSTEERPKRDNTEARLQRIDALADAGSFAEAVRAIDQWLPSARQPALRRELLLRKGRWLLDLGADGRAALLSLKGALILAPHEATTRFELLRAMTREGDASQAMDQLREFVRLRSAQEEVSRGERERIGTALEELRMMQRGPSRAQIVAVLDESMPELSALVR